jgi:hypothetical protein
MEFPEDSTDESISIGSQDSVVCPNVKADILASISSGLERITLTGYIFSNAGASLDVIMSMVFRLENMGRDPSDEELSLWISLAEANISDFADNEGAALISIPLPVPHKRSNKGDFKKRVHVPSEVLQLYSVVPKRDILIAFESAQKARRSSLSPMLLGTPRTLFGLGIFKQSKF